MLFDRQRNEKSYLFLRKKNKSNYKILIWNKILNIYLYYLYKYF